MDKRDFTSTPFLLGAALLSVYFLPFIVSGDSSIVTVHDNLDGIVPHYLALVDEGKVLAGPNVMVDAVLGGQLRMFGPTGVSVQALLFSVFAPFTAYILNFILVHLIAFMGMYVLLRRNLLHEYSQKIAALVSVSFALVPFYAMYGVSVAGIPVVAFAFINLYRGKGQAISFVVLFLFPFYSSLILVGVFVIVLALGFLAYHYIMTKELLRPLLTGVALLTAAYIVTHYQVLYQFLFAGIPSHRLEIVTEMVDFVTVIDNAFNFFQTIHFHVGNPVSFLALVAIVALVGGLANKHRHTVTILALVGTNMLISFIQSVANWEMIEPVYGVFPVTFMFQWNRFYFLSPALWFVTFGYSLVVIRDSIAFIRNSILILALIAVSQLFVLWKYNSDFRETTYRLFSDKNAGWSFSEFFDNELFNEIKVFIDRPIDSYRVASVGLHPSVAQANGFRTIDGYVSSYPLSYKRHFREIIAAELERSPTLKEYYDGWGSRCYLFSSELGYNFQVDKGSGHAIEQLNFDFTRGPAVDFIFSAVEIRNAPSIGLTFMRSFETPDSKWRIHVYKVRPRLTNANSVEVSVKLKMRLGDFVQLFYVPEGGTGYDEEFSVRTLIEGREDFQTVSFRIADTLRIVRMRLDLGVYFEQKSVVVDGVTITRGNGSIEIPVNTLMPNQYIRIVDRTFIMEPVNGRYDPYCEFDAFALQAYDSLRVENR